MTLYNFISNKIGLSLQTTLSTEVENSVKSKLFFCNRLDVPYSLKEIKRALSFFQKEPFDISNNFWPDKSLLENTKIQNTKKKFCCVLFYPDVVTQDAKIVLETILYELGYHEYFEKCIIFHGHGPLENMVYYKTCMGLIYCANNQYKFKESTTTIKQSLSFNFRHARNKSASDLLSLESFEELNWAGDEPAWRKSTSSDEEEDVVNIQNEIAQAIGILQNPCMLPDSPTSDVTPDPLAIESILIADLPPPPTINQSNRIVSFFDEYTGFGKLRRPTMRKLSKKITMFANDLINFSTDMPPITKTTSTLDLSKMTLTDISKLDNIDEDMPTTFIADNIPKTPNSDKKFADFMSSLKTKKGKGKGKKVALIPTFDPSRYKKAEPKPELKPEPKLEHTSSVIEEDIILVSPATAVKAEVMNSHNISINVIDDHESAVKFNMEIEEKIRKNKKKKESHDGLKSVLAKIRKNVKLTYSEHNDSDI